MKIQKDNDRVWAQFTSTDFTKSIYQAMQEFSDQQNSSIIKEVEELKDKIKCWEVSAKAWESKISKLKEELEKI